MRIADLTAYHVRIPLRKTIEHASHTRNETESLLVRCRLDDGTEGWGEGLPRAYVTGESIDEAWALLTGADWPALLGEPLATLADAVALCGGISLAPHAHAARNCYGNSVRCAIEIAVLDAACRHFGLPLSEITTLVAEAVPLAVRLPEVRYSAVITGGTPYQDWTRALKVRYYKFPSCKVKLGIAGQNDAATLRRLRRVLGSKMLLRADANEAWTCETLPARVAPLLPFGLTSLEQPVPHAQVQGLATVRKQVGIPIMLDESLCSLQDATTAIETGTCDLFNIRLSKCGGFIPSLKIAALARGAGLGYQLGCQVGETGILSAAGRHFATSVSHIRDLEGSYDRFLVAERLTVEDVSFQRGGRAPALRGPGLGVAIDPSAVRRVTLREVSIPVAKPAVVQSRS